MASSLRDRLREKNSDDRAEAVSFLVLGVPFAVGACFFFGLAIWFLLILAPIPGSWGLKAGLSAAVVLAVVILDTWKHPSEEWYRARYYLADGRLADAEDGGVSYLGADGWFAGMPAMASVTDPSNLAARGRAISSGFANVVLGGPRNIRKALEKLALIRRRSRPPVVDAADAFVDWLGKNGPADDPAVREILGERPEWRSGLLLAGELGLLSTRKADGVSRLALRGVR